jgi:uncharacterized coiled-coil protein SlyX
MIEGMTDDEIMERRATKELCQRQLKTIKDLNQTLDYARQELRKTDRRVAEIVDRTRLTQKEREALRDCIHAYGLVDDDEECASLANTLRGLLERLK